MEYYNLLIAAAVILAASMFCFSIAAIVYVSWRFLSLVITLDASIARSMQYAQRPTMAAQENQKPMDEQIKELMATRFTPTEGGHDTMTDEQAWMQEQAEALRESGWNEEEIQAQLKQVVATIAEEEGRPTKFTPQATSTAVEG